MNFQFTHVSFMVVIHSYPLYPTAAVLLALDPIFTLDPSTLGNSSTACIAPILVSFPCSAHFLWPCAPHIPLCPPLQLTSSQNSLHIGISWGAFKVLMPGWHPQRCWLYWVGTSGLFKLLKVILMWSQGWETLTFTWALLETWVPSALFFCVLLKHSFTEVNWHE